MPETAQVLRMAARRTEKLLRDLIGHYAEHERGVAGRIRLFGAGSRAVDEQSSGLLRPLLRLYQLRDSNGKPIGVTVGGAGDALEEKGLHIERKPSSPRHDGTRGANLSTLGHFEVHAPDDVDPVDNYRKWLNGEKHYKPKAKWIQSSPFEDDVLDGRPPVLILAHHGNYGFPVQTMNEPWEVMKEPWAVMKKKVEAAFGRTLPDEASEKSRKGVEGLVKQLTLPDEAYQKSHVNAKGLVELLEHHPFLRRALDFRPGSPVLLLACGVGPPDAQVFADRLKVVTHYSTGMIGHFYLREIIDAVWDDSNLPFSIPDDELKALASSLKDAPQQLKDVGEKHGSFVLAAYDGIQTVRPTFMA
jgi:hypothetical protein